MARGIEALERIMTGRIVRRSLTRKTAEAWMKCLENRLQLGYQNDDCLLVGPRWGLGWVGTWDIATKISVVERILEKTAMVTNYQVRRGGGEMKYQPSYENYFLCCWVPKADITAIVPDALKEDNVAGASNGEPAGDFYERFPIWIPVIPTEYSASRYTAKVVDHGFAKLENGVHVLHLTDWGQLIPKEDRTEFIRSVFAADRKTGDTENVELPALSNTSSLSTAARGTPNIAETTMGTQVRRTDSTMLETQKRRDSNSSTGETGRQLTLSSSSIRSGETRNSCDTLRRSGLTNSLGNRSSNRNSNKVYDVEDNSDIGVDAEDDEKISAAQEPWLRADLLGPSDEPGTKFVAVRNWIGSLRQQLDPVFDAVQEMICNQRPNVVLRKMNTSKGITERCDESFQEQTGAAFRVGSRPDGVGRMQLRQKLSSIYLLPHRWIPRVFGRHLYTGVRNVSEAIQKSLHSTRKAADPTTYRNFDRAVIPEVDTDKLQDVLGTAQIVESDLRPLIERPVLCTDEDMLWFSLSRALQNLFYETEVRSHKAAANMEYSATYSADIKHCQDRLKKFESTLNLNMTKGDLKKAIKQLLRTIKADFVSMNITRKAHSFLTRGFFGCFTFNWKSTASILVDLPIFQIRRSSDKNNPIKILARRPVDGLYLSTHMSSVSDLDAIKAVVADETEEDPLLRNDETLQPAVVEPMNVTDEPKILPSVI